jgi:phosphatidate cytidylyltransferase
MSGIKEARSAPSLRTASEGVLRLLFGLFLAIVAVALAFNDPNYFGAVTVLMALFAAREWHRLVRSPEQRAIADNRPIHIQTAISAFAIACAVVALLLRVPVAAFALLGCGAAAAFVFAQARCDHPLWHAAGVAYIGLPSLALVGLQMAAKGPTIVVGMFLIVWATDTGALVFGKLIGGKKLWPAVSPGKTWAGTIGGSVTAAVIFSLYILFFGFDVSAAFVFALGLSVVAHLGDLFESFVKRRFGTKDSGGMIPGHGGVLDRMDSMFAASVVLAILVFWGHLNPMFGGHS